MGFKRQKPDLSRHTWFTTSQVGELCGASPNSVARWADSGVIRCARIPSGPKQHAGDRRFHRDDVIAFMRDHGYALPRELIPNILLATPDTRLSESLRHLLVEMRIDVATNLYEIGHAIGSAQSDGVTHQLAIIDAAGLGRHAAVSVAIYLPGVHLIGIAGEDDSDFAGFASAGYKDMFQAPVNPDILAHRIREITIAKVG